MIANITNYFANLNSAGQALFIVGVLLVITFIALLITVFKPEKNKVKKIYGESAITDRENIFEEKMKDIDNIGIDDINIENDKTRNLKNIVDELKHLESKAAPTMLEKIEAYEDEQEDTAIISVEELFKANNAGDYVNSYNNYSNSNSTSNNYSNNSYRGNNYANDNLDNTQVFQRDFVVNNIVHEPKNEIETSHKEFDVYNRVDEVNTPVISSIPVKEEVKEIVEEKKYEPRREVFSSVFAESQSDDQSNEMFLKNLKEFRNNL